MKQLMLPLLFISCIACNSKAQQTQGDAGLSGKSYASKAQQVKNDSRWEVYLAQYDGHPGSAMLNIDLVKIAPLKQLPNIVITGVTFTNCDSNGFPEKNEFNNLYEVSDDVEKVIAKSTKMETAGTFTYQCERLDYIYVQDTAGLRVKLNDLYQSKYAKYKAYINIKPDPDWEAYLKFLYPSEITLELTRNQKVVAKLIASGDDLSKSRKVDHWIYFSNTSDRDKFKKIVAQKGYKIELEEKLNTQSDKSYKLNISRVDKVDVNSITKITLFLSKKAKELNGDYDGWETSVEKK